GVTSGKARRRNRPLTLPYRKGHRRPHQDEQKPCPRRHAPCRDPLIVSGHLASPGIPSAIPLRSSPSSSDLASQAVTRTAGRVKTIRQRRRTVHFFDDSLYPENQEKLVIQAAPYGPEWLPGDADDLPLTMDEHVQAAVDCYNAGATVLHIHVRELDGHGSK